MNGNTQILYLCQMMVTYLNVLTLPGKLIEEIVHTRISLFLENHSLLDPNQGGFRKNNSTITSIANYQKYAIYIKQILDAAYKRVFMSDKYEGN